MRRTVTSLFLVAALVAGCNGDDDTAPDAASDTGTEAGGERSDGGTQDGSPRFCDAYLTYLADSTLENLEAVEQAASDPLVSEYAGVIGSDAGMDRLLAATLDLDDLARSKCQAEWTAGAQGAGDTPAAAQAFLDALVAGDEVGARNVASANAIAVFEPWEPIQPDPDLGTPTVGEIGGQSFSLVLGAASVAHCEVETGVVVACELNE